MGTSQAPLAYCAVESCQLRMEGFRAFVFEHVFGHIEQRRRVQFPDHLWLPGDLKLLDHGDLCGLSHHAERYLSVRLRKDQDLFVEHRRIDLLSGSILLEVLLQAMKCGRTT